MALLGQSRELHTDSQHWVTGTQRVISYLDFAKKEGRGRILFAFLDLLEKHVETWQIFVGLT